MAQEALFEVVGVGHAIMDVLASAEEGFLERHGLAKGAMTLIDAGKADRIYAEMGSPAERSGGSAANTMVGLASLGARCAYVGKVRGDALGRLFRRDIREAGVDFDTDEAAGGPPTGRCLVLVTPDSQRTMATFLGASASVAPADVDPDVIQNARITYLEGYLWDPAPAKAAFLQAAGVAHEAGRKVALSLSDSFCVDRHRTEFRELVTHHVDILFANEAELISLTESTDFDSAVGELRGSCEIAALTRGAEGSVVLSGGEVTQVDPEPVTRVVDTTGAGDLYASGFLYGLSRGLDARTCGRIGGIAAAEVIGHFGARPQVSLRDLVERRLGRI
jgi:sugar/nucleoside kinase (ribokinase family)